MSEQKVVRQLEILKERKRGLRAAVLLFHYVAAKVDEFNVCATGCTPLNEIRTSKERLAGEFNVTPQTVGNWLRALADVGAIKYKYSGTIRLNPNIYFSGTIEQWERTSKEYESFRSDI